MQESFNNGINLDIRNFNQYIWNDIFVMARGGGDPVNERSRDTISRFFRGGCGITNLRVLLCFSPTTTSSTRSELRRASYKDSQAKLFCGSIFVTVLKSDIASSIRHILKKQSPRCT